METETGRVREQLEFGEMARGRSARGLGARALGLCLSLWLAACGDETKPHGPADEGDIEVRWRAGAGEIATTLRKEKLFEDLAEALNDTFKLPRDLPVTHAECGEENAYYDPSSGELTMCYELLDSIAALAFENLSSEEEYGERVVGTWAFVFFHELGHGLIDLYDLPVTGKEEDAVDDFSTLLLIETDLADYAIRAAEYWSVSDSGEYDPLSFADEHSLSAQRFYSILCLVYGSDPDTYEGLVTEGYLPLSRAQRCPAEYQQKLEAWETLLEPWAK